MLDFVYDDGGRSEAGFKGVCGDCGTRAIAIAMELPYKDVYNELNSIRKELYSKARSESQKRLLSGSVRNGTAVVVMDEFMKRHGWSWVATMRIGSGCKVHLCDMPKSGRFVCRVAKHFVCIADGAVRDIFEDDPFRCVYGYWKK